MTDYVYYCRDGKNEELRYSIRSLEKNLPNVNVWVVGGKPDWYTGNFIPVEMNCKTKFENVKKQFAEIVNSTDIEEEFVLMNDDFFVLTKMDSVPVLHGGLLSDKYHEHKRLAGPGTYTDQLFETYKNLVSLNIEEPLNYELHVPMTMTKTGLGHVLDMPGMVRSAYGNIFNVGGEYSEDPKIVRRAWEIKNNNGMFVSTLDTTFTGAKDHLLGKMFSEPSSYE
jgi:hypothetical protein